MRGQRDQSQALRAYVPRLVIHWLRETPEAKFREVEGSLAFVDISGFTKLTERLAKRGKVGAEELNDILDRCFTDLLAVAYADGAGLIKWGGDAVLLLFTGENHAGRASRAAFRMRKKLREIGKIVTASGVVMLRMSVGVHSGTFMVNGADDVFVERKGAALGGGHPGVSRPKASVSVVPAPHPRERFAPSTLAETSFPPTPAAMENGGARSRGSPCRKPQFM